MTRVSSLRTERKFKKTEIGEIPVDWDVLALDDISEEIYRYPTYYNINYVKQGIPEVRGALIKSNGTLETDLSKYRSISPETAAEFPRTFLREGDFVMSVRGTMGKVAIIPNFLDGANMTANLIRISPDRNKIFPLFFHQVLIGDKFQKILNIASSSTTIKTIKAPELKRLKFAIPPLREQKKIAEILTTVDETIEKSDEVIEKTKEFKKGLMQELLTRGIGHKKFRKTKIGEIPMDWNIVQLGSIAKVTKLAGFEYSRYFEGYRDKGEIIVIRGSNIKDSKLDLRDIKTIPVKISDSLERSKLHKNDLVFAYVGTIGPVALVEEDHNYHLGPNTSKITPSKAVVYPKYLFQFFRSNLIKNEIQKYISVGAQPSLSMTKIRKFEIVIPNDLSEQKKIAEILSTVDEDIERAVDNKKKLETIKKGLMQVLLTGQVRVKGV